MKNATFSTLTLMLGLSLSALAVNADTAIPDKVRQHLLKRHPQAIDLQATEESHFGNQLLKVSFKENEQLDMELYKSNGYLFSNVMPVEDPTPLSSELLKTLKQEFPEYQFKKAEMVANPNGVGEEYSIQLVANGVTWLVKINEKGQLLGKNQL